MDDAVRKFGELIGRGMQIQAEHRNRQMWENHWRNYGNELAKKYASVTDEKLKAMWDDIDCPDNDAEEIHFELNRRGLGEYCAV